MEVIFLIGTIQSFFLASLLLGKGKKPPADRFLFLVLLSIGLLLLDHYLRVTNISYENPHLLGTHYLMPMIFMPSLYLYIVLLTSKEQKLRPVNYLHFIPFITWTIWLIAFFYFLSAGEKLEFFNVRYQGFDFAISALEITLIAQAPIYSILSLFALRKHNRNIGNEFSYKGKINLNWLRFLVFGLLILSVISLVMNLISDIMHWKAYLDADSLSLAVLTVFVFLIGYFGIKQKAIYSDPDILIQKAGKAKKLVNKKEQNQALADRYKHSGLRAEEKKLHRDRLINLMDTESLHLENKLSLKQVAERLDISSNTLSQVINEMLGKNFFDFINSYRVEEVKKRMNSPEFGHYSLLAIAFDSGFNSKSSFNEIFKKITGHTPSQYQKLSHTS